MAAATRQQERERTRREALTQARKQLRTEISHLNTLMRDHADHLDRVEVLGLLELARHIADHVIDVHSEARCVANRDRAEAGTL